MPNYDYFCPANNKTIEVSHHMDERIATWGELCEKAGLAPGTTSPDSPVEKKFTCCQVSTHATPDLPCGRSKCACC